MKIGTGGNSLPGCAPTPDNVTPAVTSGPPPLDSVAPGSMPMPASPAVTAERGNSKPFMLAVVLVVLLLTGGAIYLGHGNVGAGFGEAKKGVLKLAARYLPGPGAVTTNVAVALTPTQQQLVSDYSPAKPINEAKRVKAVAGSRVEGQEAIEPAQVMTSDVAVVAGRTVPAPAMAATPGAPAAVTPVVASPAAAVPSAAVKPSNWPAIKITAVIAGQNARSFARVNNRLVSVGDTVDSMNVLAISTQRVTLAWNGQQRDFYVGTAR